MPRNPVNLDFYAVVVSFVMSAFGQSFCLFPVLRCEIQKRGIRVEDRYLPQLAGHLGR
jgi:hypothetical protein